MRGDRHNRRVSHMPAGTPGLVDAVEMQARDRASVGVIGIAKAHQCSLPRRERKPDFVVDDFAEAFALVIRVVDGAKQHVSKRPGDLQCTDGVGGGGVLGGDKRINGGSDVIECRALGERKRVTNAAVGGNAERHRVVGID